MQVHHLQTTKVAMAQHLAHRPIHLATKITTTAHTLPLTHTALAVQGTSTTPRHKINDEIHMVAVIRV